MSAYGLIDGVAVRSAGTYAVSGRATNIDFLSDDVSAKSSNNLNVINRKPMISHISTSKDSAQKLSEVGRAANELNETMKSFDENSREKGDSFEKARQLVKNHNAVLDAANQVSSSSLKREAKELVDFTKANAEDFAKIGISITDSGVLQIDENQFRASDADTVKNLFWGNEKYGQQIEQQTNVIKDVARRELLKSNTYSALGAYSNNYNYSLESYI